jgi:hypothetical protein
MLFCQVTFKETESISEKIFYQNFPFPDSINIFDIFVHIFDQTLYLTYHSLCLKYVV